MRFSYGQTIYLNAVCKSLKNSHFILKMYKPCKIVCPNERKTVRENNNEIIEEVVEDPSDEQEPPKNS